MSTRTNIVIKDHHQELWFYRHSDGYPDGTMPTLQQFIGWVRYGKIRRNVEQASGWLILLGAVEYQTLPKGRFPEAGKPSYERDDTAVEEAMEFAPEYWQCGAYEPATGVHGDIEFLYVVDLQDMTITCYDSWSEDGKGENELFVDTAESPWLATIAEA